MKKNLMKKTAAGLMGLALAVTAVYIPSGLNGVSGGNGLVAYAVVNSSGYVYGDGRFGDFQQNKYRRIDYTFDSSTGVLSLTQNNSLGIITGSTMAESSKFPWDGDTRITEIVVNEGFSSISAGAFDGVPNLQTLTIPASVTTIAADAANWESIEIVYNGTAEQFDNIKISGNDTANNENVKALLQSIVKVTNRVWVWEEDRSLADYTILDSNGNVTETVEDSDIELIENTLADCTEGGYKTYKAEVTYNDKTYSNTITDVFEPADHTYSEEIIKDIDAGSITRSYRVCTKCGHEEDLAFAEMSAQFGESINVVFSITTPADKSASFTYKIGDAEQITEEIPAGTTKQNIFAEVAAKNMGDTITYSLTSNNEVLASGQTSVKAYLENFLDNPTYGGFARAAINYGSAAQVYLNQGGTAYDPVEYDSTEAENFGKGIAFDKASLPEGITYSGLTLLLKTETQVRLYFKSAEEIDGATKSADGKNYIVTTEGFSPTALDISKTVTINGTDIELNPMMYVNLALEKDGALKNMAEALRNYGYEGKKLA